MHLLYKIEVRHTAILPKDGPLIICSNHIHNFDPALMAMGVQREIRFMAKVEMFTWPVIGFIARQAGAFPVKRGSADIQAVKHSLNILKKGEVLGIFPEGTRSKTGQMNELFQGVAMLAEKTGALIVPAAITGQYKFRGKLRILFGQPVTLDELCHGQPYSRALATKGLMDIISGLRETAS